MGFQLNEESISRLKTWQDALPELQFQKEAMILTRQRIPANKSVIGFVGGLWTLFVYAVEGSHAGSLTVSKKSSELYQNFCKLMLPLIRENIRLQFEGGADVVMIFDTAAGELSPAMYQRWVAPWAGMGFDHRWDLPSILNGKTLSAPGFVQGNFDQSLLFLSATDFEKEFRNYLKSYQELSPEQRSSWICGLGHGVLPKTPEENVRRFVQIVREVFA